MDHLRARRLRRLTQAVYDSAAAQRGEAVERRQSRWLPGPMTLLALGVVILAIAGLSVWRTISATPGTPTLQSGDLSPTTPSTIPSGAAGAGPTSPGPTPAGTSPPGSAPGAPGGAGAPVVIVYVTGEVTAPGIVELPEGSRVVDALDAAGGARAGADLDSLNLARPLVDGEHLVVWARGKAPPAGPDPGAGAPGAAPTCVDLDTADASALETLDGVGPALAARIVDYREQVGTITSAEQLDEVPGIGAALVERIAAGVCP